MDTYPRIPSYMYNISVTEIPGQDRPKSLKQIVTAPRLNARQQVLVSRVLAHDYYKGLTRVTEGVAR